MGKVLNCNSVLIRVTWSLSISPQILFPEMKFLNIYLIKLLNSILHIIRKSAFIYIKYILESNVRNLVKKDKQTRIRVAQ